MNSEETSRSYKPSLALYRPPNARSKLLSRASTLQHIQASSSSAAKKSNQISMKGSLKRSKSFGSTECSNGVAGLGEFNLSTEQMVLIKRALDNPNSLNMNQLMEVVSLICSKAMETSANSFRLAKMCISIADKDKNQLFLEALINCCREWFNERDKLIKTQGQHTKNNRWLAYIAFVTDLYLNVKSKHRRVRLLISAEDGKGKSSNEPSLNFPLKSLPEETSDDEESDERQDLGAAKGGSNDQDDIDSYYLFNLSSRQARSLAMLLYDCCNTILISLPTSNSPAIDIECLLSVIRSVGRFIEEDNSQRMEKIVYLIRELYLGPFSNKLSAMSLKSLLELIECRASQWQFDKAQQIYYFPYTKP